VSLTESGRLGHVRTVWDQWGWTAKLAISIALFWAVVKNADASLTQFHIAEPGYIVLATIVFLVQPIVNIPRWSIVLQMLGYRIPIGKLARYFYIGSFFNQVLPASVSGDILRVFYLNRHAVAWRHSISSVLLDRLVALGGLVILYVACFNLASPRVVGHPDAETLYYLFITGILLGALALALLYLSTSLWIDLLRKLHWRSATQIAEMLRMFLRSAEVLGSNLWQSIVILGGLGVTVHLIESFGLWLVVQAFGYSVPFFDIAAIAALMIIVQSLPISFGGWGAREMAAVVLLQRVGIQAGDAFFISVILGLMFLIAAVPGTVFWLLMRRERPDRQPMRTAQGGEPEPSAQPAEGEVSPSR